MSLCRMSTYAIARCTVNSHHLPLLLHSSPAKYIAAKRYPSKHLHLGDGVASHRSRNSQEREEPAMLQVPLVQLSLRTRTISLRVADRAARGENREKGGTALVGDCRWCDSLLSVGRAGGSNEALKKKAASRLS